MKVDYLVTPSNVGMGRSHPTRQCHTDTFVLMKKMGAATIRGTLHLKRGEMSDPKAADSSFLISDLSLTKN